MFAREVRGYRTSLSIQDSVTDMAETFTLPTLHPPRPTSNLAVSGLCVSCRRLSPPPRASASPPIPVRYYGNTITPTHGGASSRGIVPQNPSIRVQFVQLRHAVT